MFPKRLFYEIGRRLLIVAVYFIRKSEHFPKEENDHLSRGGYDRLSGVVALYDDGFLSAEYPMSIAILRTDCETPQWTEKVPIPAR
jgi:hypothetical protein